MTTCEPGRSDVRCSAEYGVDFPLATINDHTEYDTILARIAPSVTRPAGQ